MRVKKSVSSFSKSIDEMLDAGSKMLDTASKILDEVFDESRQPAVKASTTIRIRLNTQQILDCVAGKPLTFKAQGVTILLQKAVEGGKQ